MYVYILRCDNGSFYTGIALDISKRIRQHLGIISGGAKYTHAHRVVYVEALWNAPSDPAARKLEFAIKRLTHSQKKELISEPQYITEKYCTSLSEYTYENIKVSYLNDDFMFYK